MPVPNLEFMHAPAPAWLSGLFIGCTFLTAWLLARTVQRTGNHLRRYWLLAGVWLTVQAVLASGGFYQSNLHTLPPRLVLGAILPTLLGIAALVASAHGRAWLTQLNLADLAAISGVRVGVELGLYALATYHLVPELMTFSGYNFDVLAGLSAVVVASLYRRQQLRPAWLLVWHIGSLGLLLTIIVLALLTAPTPAQQLAFEQPNVAVLRFPFVWLPAFIVPVVLFSHIASIYLLVSRQALARVSQPQLP